MIRVVLAPNAFKECLSAPAVAASMRQGVIQTRANIETREIPVADGGDGTLDTLVAARDGVIATVPVEDPLGRAIAARFGLLDDGRTAVIETAEACGLRLLAPEERDVLRASSFGAGLLIRAALDRGVRRMVIGVGGSATNDAGCGLAQALGVRFLDDDGNELPRGGGALERLAHMDISGLDPRIDEVSFVAACDVRNRLLGPQGATFTYGPQKGADDAAMEQLERGMVRLTELVRRYLQIPLDLIPGGGAAGGMAAGVCAFLGAIAMKGAELVLNEVRFDQSLVGADLVITGEGCLDSQSLEGKATLAVARRAKIHGLPVIALVGIAGDTMDEIHAHGVDAVFCIAPRPVSQEESMTMASHFIMSATQQAVRLFLAAGRISPGEAH